ncbi:phosphonate transport system ATP-binding protein [Methylohalomonas lacus]|uniref:Phosphonate transport system ATP-binding protein n=1 Tax=Methylohalomonas lacus TaxID=398773 RepID=A0AAE3HIS6_9GAMM|nr:phosphonate ABC transporter ATP-binding protein [Methylohalomonas lacus]MCS3903139.1 phosphonate transport system ATP-binding protein [Methylohalomonas lacus]
MKRNDPATTTAESATDSAMIRLDGVGVTYPDGTLALHPLDLTFRQGEFTVLLGLSGAGKSTLLRTLNQLVVPSSGTISSDELGVIHGSARVRAHRRHTAMIFQQHQLLLRKSALTNVLTGRLAAHSAWRTLLPMPADDVTLAYQCLQRVGLADKTFVRADNLSGGQMQRVGIARALAQQPRVILADEPVASLDPNTSMQVLEQLSRISREDGITTIVSLHQLELARRFAQRVIGLAGGRVVFDGPPSALDSATLDQIYNSGKQDGHQPDTETPSVHQSGSGDHEEPMRAAV